MKMIILFLLVFACCCSPVFAQGIPGAENPVDVRESLEEINSLADTFLCRPPVMGVTDEAFATVDCLSYLIAEYRFQVNGFSYCFRAARTEADDISGIYLNGKNAFDAQRGEGIATASGEGIRAARWFASGVQYTLCLEDPDSVIDPETFRIIAEEMMDCTSTDADGNETDDLSGLAGEYMDSWSERARLTLTVNGEGNLEIEVSWADSAFEYVRWTMSISDTENNRLSYTDCSQSVVSENGEGNEIVATVYDKGEGYFTVSGSRILWDGAADEDCRDCVFEKTEY